MPLPEGVHLDYGEFLTFKLKFKANILNMQFELYNK